MFLHDRNKAMDKNNFRAAKTDSFPAETNVRATCQWRIYLAFNSMNSKHDVIKD